MRKITHFLLCLAIIATCASYIRVDESGNTVGRLAVIPALLSWVLYKLETRRFRPWGPLVYAMVGMVVWSCISVGWTVDMDLTKGALSRLFSNMLMVGLIWDMGLTKKEAQGLFQAFVIAFYVGFYSVIKNAASGNSVIEDRFTADGFHADATGFYVLLGMPIAWYLGTNADLHPITGRQPVDYFLRGLNGFFRILNMFYPVMAMLTVILSATRADLLLAVPILIYILTTLRKGSIWVTLALAGGVVGLAAAIITGKFATQIDRLATSFSTIFTDGGNGRIDTWRVALNAFAHHPFIGTGANTAAANSLKVPGDHVAGAGLAVHNMYFQSLEELGLVGFGIVVTISFFLLQRVKYMPKGIRAATYVSIWTFILGNSQLPTLISLQNWIYMAVVGSWVSTYAVVTMATKAKAPIEIPTAPIPAKTPVLPA